MFHAIETVATLPDYQLSVLFRSGENKVYDMGDLMAKNEAFRSFRLTRGLFEQAKVAAGGYGVYWNDDIDISCNELYMNGKPTIESNGAKT
ncbi:MAG: DUF2442 domain-containing protein [Treponema sp.]|nr:DUF2442 domain-containing protein [Treponema sp.]